MLFQIISGEHAKKIAIRLKAFFQHWLEMVCTNITSVIHENDYERVRDALRDPATL
jgi:hypothetical protein